MKEKIISYLKSHRAQLVLFLLALVPTVVTGSVTSAFCKEAVTAVAVGASIGTLTVTGVYSLAAAIGFGLPQDRLHGILGIITGIFILLAFI